MFAASATMSGYTTGTTVGECTTTSFEASGQSGVNPPKICGTNTDYHSKFVSRNESEYSSFQFLKVYVEFGASATDSVTLKHTLDTVAKSWNILTRQIACTATWKLVKFFFNFLIFTKYLQSPH